MPAAFSRLQLAAALLEYDNDPDDPYAPRRSAQDSAIFAHLRRNPAAPPQTSARQSDYLGVSLPSETGSLGGRESALGTRRSRSSIDALRNPFGADSNDEEEEAEEELEVDLTSWGLDAFMPKDKSKKGKGKAHSVAATAPPMTTVHSHIPSTNAEQVLPVPRRAVSYSRARSLGGSLDFIRETTTSTQVDFRRRSIGSPLDVINMDPSRINLQRPRSNSAGFMQDSAESSQGIPFPTGATRAISPSLTESVPGRRSHERTYSMASMNSRLLLAEVKEESRAQTEHEDDEDGPTSEDNPFALQPPAHTSRFDPKNSIRARTASNASIGTRALLNDDRNSVMTGGGENFMRERRYSTTLDLLRPKVLVMPSPLQSVAAPEPPPPDNRIRDGFMLTKDGPPLPPGARTSRRMSTLLSGSDTPPVASNSFTPNPLNDLTYAQKLFRNTLAMGGHSDAYPEDLPRATQDGEQAELYPAPAEVEEVPTPVLPPPETTAMKRAPGKLYGKSLIDDLEIRKANMRSKQRVFTGDQRPSMMARPDIQRSSTFIDPESLARPTSQFMNSSGLGKPIRRNSGNIKPLLSFDNVKIPQTAPIPNHSMGTRSVFGVDTLWEREVAKLREIEAREKIEEEERKKREEEEERRRGEKKDKKKRKHKKRGAEEQLLSEGLLVPQAEGTELRVSIEPPILPTIERATRRPPPPPVDDDEEEESDEEEIATVPPQVSEPAWHAGSSDEEDNGARPRRTTGVGPRYTTNNVSVRPPVDSDSDEDLPLAATLHKARKPLPTSRPLQPDSDEDEEKPLSSILAKAKAQQPSSSLLNINFDEMSLKGTGPDNADGEEDDDEPLALRASRIPPAFNSRGDGGDDDDRPLALHPEQQRRTQYNMLAQQQQQQMMMQAQFHNNMFFNPPMMGSGFFPPPMAAPMMNPVMMMQPPVSIPSPPPVHDAAKFGRVDRWRRDVAVEGER